MAARPPRAARGRWREVARPALPEPRHRPFHLLDADDTLGGGLNDVRFLAECGATLTVTDLESASDLETSVAALSSYDGITYVLGEHRLEDFRTADFVLEAAGVPLDSPYIAEARRSRS